MLVSILAIVFVLRISKNSNHYAPNYRLLLHNELLYWSPKKNYTKWKKEIMEKTLFLF